MQSKPEVIIYRLLNKYAKLSTRFTTFFDTFAISINIYILF